MRGRRCSRAAGNLERYACKAPLDFKSTLEDSLPQSETDPRPRLAVVA